MSSTSLASRIAGSPCNPPTPCNQPILRNVDPWNIYSHPAPTYSPPARSIYSAIAACELRVACSRLFAGNARPADLASRNSSATSAPLRLLVVKLCPVSHFSVFLLSDWGARTGISDLLVLLDIAYARIVYLHLKN